MKIVFVLENIRSAYNVGNIIRSADAFGFDIIISGYTPSPFSEGKVLKTSLGAEKKVKIIEFYNPKKTIDYLKSEKYFIIACEKTNNSISLLSMNEFFDNNNKIALILGNEVDGVCKETLSMVNLIVHIPMNGIKESFNVGHAGVIFMREINRLLLLK